MVPACLAGFFAACRTSVHTIELTFRADPATGFGLSGFDCVEPVFDVTADADAPPLANHAIKACGGPGTINLVVDLITVGGLPRCDAESMILWCQSHLCSPVPSTRVCLPVALADDAGPGDAAVQAVKQAVLSVKNQLFLDPPPADYSVVRMVATTEPCSVLLGGKEEFDCSYLIGCALSCAVSLPSYSADELQLALDLGPLDTRFPLPTFAQARQLSCGVSVEVCAGTPIPAPGVPLQFCKGTLDSLSTGTSCSK
jgi:hypothetical protein